MFEVVRNEGVVDIGTAHQRMVEAEGLLRARIGLSALTGVPDDEYVRLAMELRAQESAWAKRWGVK
ncbi:MULTISPECIES: hypothetical protein [unclassified Neptuniibacter]|uniref:hypothetical protein n=1 Tax=unclassified Neptuniibacter TaxID=2630693 RepID=UPI000C55B0DF|nr:MULTISPECIES: hypothetical protein [unclassified Neptuniibacter]MAY42407.1 hypothetical protein [Oceanospirillaceae bacterium]|tara:strand:- start:28046 stop:28243 length:198 start_codon:yes stop_codon:yes gene_type:complete